MAEYERIKPYEAKKALTTVINKVAYGKVPVIFESRGKDLAALISMDQFRFYERLMDALEARMDLEEAERALNDPENQERIPWKVLKDEFDLRD